MKLLKAIAHSVRQISGKKALMILSGIIIIHMALMSYYLQDSRLAKRTARRDAVIQKIINVIYLLEATPSASRPKAVSAMEDPDLHVSLTQNPKWDLRFSQISFWGISRALEQDLGSFAISIQFEKNQWLNLNATLYSHFLAAQFILMFLELFVLGCIFVAAWSISRFVRPLENFKDAAERLGIDLHSQPLDVYGPSVAREAAEAINRMQRRIIDLINDRTQMIAAISHDLRTPITRLKLRTQFIDDANLSESIIRDLDEMEKMIDETMAFAREDSANEEKKSLDLVSLLNTICDDACDMGHDVTFYCELQRIVFFGRSLALKRAFTNLIHNGARYGKRVRVTIKKQGKKIVVIIDDEGPGIPETELSKVFKPFYRGERSRSRDTGGVGLGLALTRDIISVHDGKIKLENRVEGGLRVVVQLGA